MTITLVLIIAVCVAYLFLYQYKKRQGRHKEWRYKILFSVVTLPLLLLVIFLNVNQIQNNLRGPFGNLELDSKEQVQVFNEFYSIFLHGIDPMLVQQESLGTKLSIKALNESLEGKWVFEGQGTKKHPALTITNGPFHKPYSFYWEKTDYGDTIFVIQTKGNNMLEYRHLYTAAGDGKSCTLGFTPDYLNLNRNSDYYDGLCGKPVKSYNTFSFPVNLIDEYLEKMKWTHRFLSFVRTNVHVGTTARELNIMLGLANTQMAQVDKKGKEIGTIDLGYVLIFEPKYTRKFPVDAEGFIREKIGAQLLVKTDRNTSEVVDYSLIYSEQRTNRIVLEDIHGNKTYYLEQTIQ
jgi:hypothetical protein